MANISNLDDVIDSRAVIERIEELESELAAFMEETEGALPENFPAIEELMALRNLANDAIQYSSDWEYGESLINRNYFEEYMDEMVEDCYELPKDLPYWMSIKLDYVALEQDYTSVDFDGQEYLIRNS